MLFATNDSIMHIKKRSCVKAFLVWYGFSSSTSVSH